MFLIRLHSSNDLPNSMAAGMAPTGISIGGAFTLVDGAGRTVRQDSFPGRYLLVYFGYTTCPDVCPTTLQTIAGALRGLGSAAGRVVPLVITVDPARDRPGVMARYVALFDPHLIGLTGTATQIAQAEAVYRVFAQRVDEPGGGSYLFDHTSYIYFMAPDGQLVALFNADASAPSMAATMARLMR